MNGLRNARVVVVDDQPDHGLKLIQAFSRMGIASAYFTGMEDDLSEGKLKGVFKGVRLLAVDMVLLETASEAGSPRFAVTVVDNLLEENHGPFIIIAWTRHDDIVEEFENLLDEQRPDLKPCLVVKISKPEVMSDAHFHTSESTANGEKQKSDGFEETEKAFEAASPNVDENEPTGSSLNDCVWSPPERSEMHVDGDLPVPDGANADSGKDPDETSVVPVQQPTDGHLVQFDVDSDMLVQKLEEHMRDWFPLDLILDWEQRVHDAASASIATLFEIVPAPWNEGIERLLVALAHASGGKKLESPAFALRSLLDALNPIHFDHIGQSAHDVGDTERSFQRLLASNQTTLPGSLVGRVNRMLLLDTSAPDRVLPGNVYVQGRWTPPDSCPIRDGAIPPNDLVSDLFDTKELPQSAAQVIAGYSVPVLVEINPACDHASQKAKYARLVAGLLIPDLFCNSKEASKCGKRMEKLAKKFKAGSLFVKVVGPFQIDIPEIKLLPADYSLVLDAHYIHGLRYEDLAQQREAFRLRSHVLVDVQSWFASHASRPGIVSV